MTVRLKPNKYSPLVLAAVLAKYGDKTIIFKFKKTAKCKRLIKKYHTHMTIKITF